MTDIDNKLPAPLSELRSLVQWDYFCYRQYSFQDFDSILDVGCNTGTLSTFTHMLFPFAHIHSVDASPRAFVTTCKYRSFFNRMNGRHGGGKWDVYNLGLGDGNPIALKEGYYTEDEIHNTSGKPGLGVTFVPSGQTSNPTEIETLTLSGMIEKFGIDLEKNNSIKLDCEGGECSLYNNDSLAILKKFRHICGEIHFPPFTGGCSYDMHYSFWSSFEDDFDYVYFKSNKQSGVGHFILTRKEDNIKGYKNLHY